MDRMLEGYVYDLGKLLRIDGYDAFILESGASETWDNEKQRYDVIHSYDLGMRRILNTSRKEAYLILISTDCINQKMEIFRLDPSGCKISDFIKEKGYKCEIIAEYGGRIGKEGKRYGQYWENWKMVLHERRGCFSENGYALQYKGWLDYTFYQFEMNILNRGWIMVEDHDIARFSLWNVTEDIVHSARGLIQKALNEHINVSGKELADALKKTGLEECIEYLRMYERDER